MKNLIPQWQLDENAKRTSSYKKSVADEVFLAELNELLENNQFLSTVEPTNAQPIILFFGIPRCGKTYFSQLVSNSLEIGWINNVTARFWRAPIVGLRLSDILNVPRGSDFQSDYGKTSQLGDLHDFHYFWHHWLNVHSFPYDPDTAVGEINWQGLSDILTQISSYWQRPGIMKAIDATYHMKRIADAYPQALFIYLQRDYIDSAKSLYKGRVDNFGDPNQWYGQAPLPHRYEPIRKLDWQLQIPAQLKYLVELFESQFNQLEEKNALRLSYRNICENPESALEKIVAKLSGLGGRITNRDKVDPTAIKFSTHSENDELGTLLAKGLKEFDLPIRI